MADARVAALRAKLDEEYAAKKSTLDALDPRLFGSLGPIRLKMHAIDLAAMPAMLRNRVGDPGMLALGSCIAGAAILIASLLAVLFRHPNPPRWTRPEIVAMLICLPLTGMIAIGLAFTVVGLWQLVNGTGNPLELVVLAAVVIGLALVWRVLRIGQRLNSYAPATGRFPAGADLAADPALVIDETSPPPPGPHTRPSGRRAA
jgi:hypothetical protein